ncbi:MAG: PF20097 family protein [Candidatus Competibacteraceae bacterium]
MSSDLMPPIVTIGLLSVGALILVWLLVRYFMGRNRVLPEQQAPRAANNYTCPDCSKPMQPGYLLFGRGAIWAPRVEKPPGSVAHIGQALPNTVSFGLPPDLNLGWRCIPCDLLLVDHRQLVRPQRGGIKGNGIFR